MAEALYRKYRPQIFEDVVGQEHIERTIKNAIAQDKVSHAYLFTGPRGTGKTTTARLLAKALLCEKGPTAEPDGTCDDCEMIAAGEHPDVYELDAASRTGVENVREEIIGRVQFAPTRGRYKVYIIDEVHMLSIGAFNALLKTLEEPPAHVVFILATTEAHKIPITITSRCQQYKFKRISIDTIAARLQDLMQREQIPAEDKALRYIAKAADGSMRDALSLLDQCIAFNLGETLTYDKALEVLGAVDTEVYSRLFRQMVAGDAVGCVEIVSEILIDGRDLTQFVNEYVWYLRGLMMLSASDQGEDMLDVSTERLAQMKEEATLADTETLIRYIRILSNLSGNLRFASQKRVLTEVAMIKLCKPQMDTEQDITTLKDRIANIEAQLEKGIVAAPQQTQSVPETVQAADEKTASTPKIMPKAIGEDVKAVLGRWRDVSAMCDPVMRNMLDQCRPVPDDDRLVLQFTDPLNEEYFTQKEGDALEQLKRIIGSLIQKEVVILTRTVDAQTDAMYPDVMELIQFDGIEIQ